jgi:hypothetical protein
MVRQNEVIPGFAQAGNHGLRGMFMESEMDYESQKVAREITTEPRDTHGSVSKAFKNAL